MKVKSAEIVAEARQASSTDKWLSVANQMTVEELASVRRRQATSKSDFGAAAIELGLMPQEEGRVFSSNQERVSEGTALTPQFSPELVCALNPQHPIAVAVYRMRTSLFLAHKGKAGPITIAVVGAERFEGKTLLAANLAVAFSQVGARTVLVDADLKNGRIHTLFGLPNDIGLAQEMSGRSPQNISPSKLPTSNLSILTAGNLVDRGNFSPEKLKTVTQNLSENNDVLIFDTSSWLVSADAQLVASQAGLALLVLRLHNSNKNTVKEMTRVIARSGASIFAVPFN